MEDLIKTKPKWRRGAPDEKIEALVIFFPELPMLLVNGQGGKWRRVLGKIHFDDINSINHTVDPKLEESDKTKSGS